MKFYLKSTIKLGILFFGISLLFWNCEKETVLPEGIDQVEEQDSTFSLKHYSREHIEKNAKLISKLKEFNDKLAKNKSDKYLGKNIYNEQYDFTIYTDSATYIQYGDYHSYTFPTLQGADEKITNVFFELNDQGEYDAFLVKYDYTANEFKSQDLNSLSLKTSMEPIDLDFSSLFARTRSAYVCIYTYTRKCCNNYVPGKGCGEVTGADYYNYGCENWAVTASFCEAVLYEDEDYKQYHQNTATITIGGTIYGGTGGSTTSPTPSPFDSEELMKINVVKSELNLRPQEYDGWINSNVNTVFEIHNFLVDNLFSDEALTEAKMRCDVELANYNGWDFSKTGTFPNRPSLKYKATYTPYLGEKMYLLDNGLVLYQSATKRIINKKDAGTLASTEYPTDGYNYIYSYSTKRWYEYRMPPPSPTAKADIDFLLDAFWDGVKIVGRYATPLEDAIILIDGKDFDGVEQSKVQTAGFMIVGVIPGGKILKPISKVIKNSDVAFAGWKVITKIGDNTITLSCKVVNGLVDFGSRSNLASIIKTTSLEEAHHIIPWNKLGDDVVQEAAYAGFHMNAKVNGKALQKYTTLTGDGLHGNHPQYDIYVQKLLSNFKIDNPGFTPELAKDFLENELIPELDNLIELAKSSGLNLNEYFRLLN